MSSFIMAAPTTRITLRPLTSLSVICSHVPFRLMSFGWIQDTSDAMRRRGSTRTKRSFSEASGVRIHPSNACLNEAVESLVCWGIEPCSHKTIDSRVWCTKSALFGKTDTPNSLLPHKSLKGKDSGHAVWPITPVLSMKKGIFEKPKIPDGGGYEIRTREAVTPTRFPSVRHRPLGESSSAFIPVQRVLRATRNKIPRLADKRNLRVAWAWREAVRDRRATIT